MSITAAYVCTALGSALSDAANNIPARILVPVGTNGVPAGGTVSWWSFEPGSGVEQVLQVGDEAGLSEPQFEVNLVAPDVQFHFYDQAGAQDAADTAPVPVSGEWVHYAVTFDAGTFKGALYINGALACEVSL